jgi:hypothetical protein
MFSICYEYSPPGGRLVDVAEIPSGSEYPERIAASQGRPSRRTLSFNDSLSRINEMRLAAVGFLAIR